MRVALIHDWLTGMRGGELVLERIAALFPEAPIYTLLHVPGAVSPALEAHPIRTSLVQRLPRSAELYRWYLPLFPWAVEHLDLGAFDLVISTSHCAAKSALPHPDAVHLCYCHTPMRYAYDQFGAYFGPERVGRWRCWAIACVMAWLRRWDRATAARVDAFAANSAWVAGRIARHYGRVATVIPPPVDTGWFVPDTGSQVGDYYLVVAALAPYKRIEVAIEAFNRMRRPLVIVGSGPEAGRLAALAGPTVELRGWVSRATLRSLYQGCRGLVLPGVEDAGIAPLEAMACGRPALVLRRGGAAEVVADGATGVHIEEADPGAVIEAVDRAERLAFNTAEIRAHAERYGPAAFARRFVRFVLHALRGRRASDQPLPVAEPPQADRKPR